METVVLVIHLLIAIALVGVILLQRSEGGALGMGGGGGGFMTGRATADLLTRTTTGLAIGFFITSMTLAVMAGGDSEKRSILDQPAPPAVEKPVVPEEPSAPLAK